ncbi:MAG: ABC transporter permease, partial [Pyrinomonadaceae bacterium]
IDPLIFSKPVSRAQYLLGKFFGNFFVLVCCQSAFALTLLVLQAFHKPQMITGPVRVLPYFKHFFFFVVVSHLALAAIYFTVGTITRNAKIVYGLAVSFYPLYMAYQINLKSLPLRWRIALDPLLMNFQSDIPRTRSADLLNQLTVSYSADMIANRALLILFAAACLTILYVRFSKTERSSNDRNQISLLNLSTSAERIYNDAEIFQQALHEQSYLAGAAKKVAIPVVNTASEGFGAHLKQFVAALGTEFRLLRAERSLVVIMPLAVFLSTLEVAFYEVHADVSYSAAFASNIAGSLLLFLFGITVFYTGEAMHRDREIGIEPVMWGVPAPNFVFLLSKFAAVFLISLSLIVLVALVSIALQIFMGQTPVELQAYLIIYALVLIPNIVFMISAAIALNVLLRDKYLAYVASLGIGGGLFYLIAQGYNHWLYNPVLYQLWTYSDLTGAGSRHTQILANRIYFLAISISCLALAHLFFERKSAKGFWTNGRPNSAGWALLITVASAAIAVVTALTF